MADLEQSNANTTHGREAGSSQESADRELFEKYLDEGHDLDMPGRGDLREGVIVEIRPTELLVNVGSKRDGVVPQSDLARLDQEFVKNLHEGQTVDVVVARQQDDEGIFILSMADALQQRDWRVAEELLANGEITVHSVVGYNKGGLTVEFNPCAALCRPPTSWTCRATWARSSAASSWRAVSARRCASR
jgi:small subunit ribosomal protein S1